MDDRECEFCLTSLNKANRVVLLAKNKFNFSGRTIYLCSDCEQMGGVTLIKGEKLCGSL